MNAKKDDNRVNTMIGILDSDGSTITRVQANPANNAVLGTDGSTGSDLSGSGAKIDKNRVPTLLAVSSADGVTPVPLYVDSNGSILMDSN